MVSVIQFIENNTPKWFSIFAIEDIFVASILIVTAIVFGEHYTEWIAAAAVFLAFKHTVAAFRLEDVVERMEKHGDTAYHSHGNQETYFYLKESLWFVYFFLLGAWSALVGVVIFLLYPLWHKSWQKYHHK